jgi:uncharacterized protein involved in exopolysaccharide biosynthesis
MDPYYTEPLEPVVEEQMHLRDYLQILKKRRYIVITVFVIITILALILGLGKKPLYTSTSKVLVERNDKGDGLGSGYTRWDPEFLPTQIEIIKSKSVTRRVVDNLQLDTRYRSYFFPDQEDKPSFIASISQSVRSFISSLFQPDKAETTNADEDTPPIEDADIIASMIQGGIQVTPVRETRVLNIMYTDRDPRMAKRIAEALVQAYMDVSLEIKLSSTQQSLKWMTSKAEQERKKLEAAERALQKYKRENNLVTVENKLAMYPQKLSQVTSELAEAESKMKELEALYNQIIQVQDDPRALETNPALAQEPTSLK